MTHSMPLNRVTRQEDLIFDMLLALSGPRSEDSLPALPFPSPDPLLQNLVSHAPGVRMTVVAQGTTPSNYYYYYYYYYYLLPTTNVES